MARVTFHLHQKKEEEEESIESMRIDFLAKINFNEIRLVRKENILFVSHTTYETNRN